MKYEHVIWDFDGTLFDTYPIMAEAFGRVLNEAGIMEPIGDIVARMKISMGHAIRYYRERHGIDDAFLERYRVLSGAMLEEAVKPFGGIVDICRAVHDSGSKNHLYTHRGSTSMHFLDKFGMTVYFSELITSESNFPRKPSPDALLFLIKKYNVISDKAIMIGDRDLDILAAVNAGMRSCFFAEGGKAYEMADYCINEFAELYSVLGI